MTDLAEIDTNEVDLLRKSRKQVMVIAFWFKDGIYIYEVDESGKKTNEIEHFFEIEE
ncbi:hypothetical protein [Marinifilum fragile]